MLFAKVVRLLQRKIRARRLGIKFDRVATFNLPASAIVRRHCQPLSLPVEKGMDGEFIEVLLDDCYGVEQLSPSLLTTHIPQMRQANFLSVVKNVSSKI
jgi:hypothetical protein